MFVSQQVQRTARVATTVLAGLLSPSTLTQTWPLQQKQRNNCHNLRCDVALLLLHKHGEVGC